MGIVLNKQHTNWGEGLQRAKACASERANRNIIFKISRSSMIWIASIILFYKIYLPGNQPLRWYGNGMAYGKSSTQTHFFVEFNLLSPSRSLHRSAIFVFVRWFTFILSTNDTEFLLAALHALPVPLFSTLRPSISLILWPFLRFVYVLRKRTHNTHTHAGRKEEKPPSACMLIKIHSNMTIPFSWAAFSNLSCKCKH